MLGQISKKKLYKQETLGIDGVGFLHGSDYYETVNGLQPNVKMPDTVVVFVMVNVVFYSQFYIFQPVTLQ